MDESWKKWKGKAITIVHVKLARFPEILPCHKCRVLGSVGQNTMNLIWASDLGQNYTLLHHKYLPKPFLEKSVLFMMQHKAQL